MAGKPEPNYPPVCDACFGALAVTECIYDYFLFFGKKKFKQKLF